nr:MAG TPA: protein of unknown function (DUF4224) [Caudoviricetes sp.]
MATKKKSNKAQDRFVSTSKGTKVVGKLTPAELAKLTGKKTGK